MKRFLAVILLAITVSVFLSVRVSASSRGVEYVISGASGEYKLSAYSGGNGSVIKRADSVSELLSYSGYTEGCRILFSDVVCDADITFSSLECEISGKISFLGSSRLIFEGSEVLCESMIFDFSESAGSLYVNSGKVYLNKCEINLGNSSKICLEETAGAELTLESSTVFSSGDSCAIYNKYGTLKVFGGKIESSATAIFSESTLILCGDATIIGSEYDIEASSRITLSDGENRFCGKVRVKYLGEFSPGEMKILFVKAFCALEGVTLYDINGNNITVTYFDLYEGIAETDFGAVYLPHTVKYYSEGVLVYEDKVLSGEYCENKSIKAEEGFIHTGWQIQGDDALYDFLLPVSADLSLEAAFKLLPPTFTLNSREFNYDGQEHIITFDSLSHPLIKIGNMSYVWYKDGEEIFNTGIGISVKNVSDSGKYKCKLIFTYKNYVSTITTPEITVTINKCKIELPKIKECYYTGALQYAGIYETVFYKVVDSGGVNAGVYPVRLTLKDFENYSFLGYSEEFITLNFTIQKADNYFLDEPHVVDIYEGQEAQFFANSRFGVASFLFSDSYGGPYTDSLPSGHGTIYTCATVPETENYHALTSSPIEFKVKRDEVIGLSVATPPARLDYLAFETFDPSELILNVKFSSGRTSRVSAEELGCYYQCADTFLYGDTGVYVKYQGLSIFIEVRVSRADYDLSGIEFTDKTFVYDGTEKTLTYKGNIPLGLDGTTLNVKTVGGGINTGAYTVNLVFENLSRNYNTPKSMSATLTITPCRASAIWDAGEFIYDGTLKSPSAYFIDALGQKCTLSVLGARSAAGAYTATATTENQNYELTNNSIDFVIKRADYNLDSLIWSTADFTYDGKEKVVVLLGLPSGVSVIGYTNNSATDAGIYNATATLSYDSINYNEPKVPEYVWEIKRAKYDISSISVCDKTAEYTSEIHYPTLCGEMPTGIDGIRLEYVWSVGAQNVTDGVVTSELIFKTKSKNYEVPTSLFATVEITPKGITVEWENLEFTYNLAPQAPSAKSDVCRVSVLGAQTNAGIYSASAISLDSNYYVTNDKCEFVIKRAANFWINHLSVSDVFYGTEPTPNARAFAGEVKYEYFYGEDSGSSATFPFAVGTVYVIAYSAGDENYQELRSLPVAFSIKAVFPVGISVALTKESFVAMSTLSAEALIVYLDMNDGTREEIPYEKIKISYKNGDRLLFGDTDVTVIYDGYSADVQINVIKADYDMSGVKWSESEYYYDGEEKRITLLGLPEGVVVTEYRGGVGINSGRYEVEAALLYDVDNYNPPIIPNGVLIIKKCVIDPPKTTPLYYNGLPQSPFVQDDKYTLDTQNAINAGEYTATLLIKDTENYEFSGGVSSMNLSFSILPRELTVTLFDVTHISGEAVPTPEYEITAGALIDGDSLELQFSVLGDTLTAHSANKNYKLTVIPAGIILAKGDNSEEIFRIFVFIISFFTLILLCVSLILRKRGVMRYFSLGKDNIINDEKQVVNTPNGKVPEDIEKSAPDDYNLESAPEVLTETMSIDVERADRLITDSLAKSLLRKDEAVVVTNGKRKGIINVDTLSKNFAPYDKIDVNRLKEMSLIPYDTAYIKVLARGIIDKPLSVYANDFSLSAIKMIALTGGESVRVNTAQKKNKQ